jgi:hypothetical protein
MAVALTVIVFVSSDSRLRFLQCPRKPVKSVRNVLFTIVLAHKEVQIILSRVLVTCRRGLDS